MEHGRCLYLYEQRLIASVNCCRYMKQIPMLYNKAYVYCGWWGERGIAEPGVIGSHRRDKSWKSSQIKNKNTHHTGGIGWVSGHWTLSETMRGLYTKCLAIKSGRCFDQHQNYRSQVSWSGAYRVDWVTQPNSRIYSVAYFSLMECWPMQRTSSFIRVWVYRPGRITGL